jgi:membrane protein implicated in regulation of membrane protease activity
MGLGKVIGWGVAFIILLFLLIGASIITLAQDLAYGAPILYLIGNLFGMAIFAIITYFVGRRFVRAVRQYKASQARKPLQ